MMANIYRLGLLAVFLTGSIFLLLFEFSTPANSSSNVAIQGYDPVSYFSGRRPVEGDPSLSHTYNGRTYHFSTAENRDRFARSPEKFAPQYDGYCAFGVARGYKVGIDPLAFKVVGGNLYLNYSRSVQRQWSRDIPGFISKADANWPGLQD